jgi:hypothetical protein
MRYHCFRGLLCVTALALVRGLIVEADEPESLPGPRELYSLKSTDGTNHIVLACGVSTSAKSDFVYLVDWVTDRTDRSTPGSEKMAQGEYLFLKLSDAGEVIWKQSLGKVPAFEIGVRPAVLIALIAAPGNGAMVIGQLEKPGVWAVRRVDGEGRIVSSAVLGQRGIEFHSAVLLPRGKGLLIAGRSGTAGFVWKIDLDGNVVWKEEYLTKTDPGQKIASQFHSLALADDTGSFVVAGDFSMINKFGAGKSTTWLMRCDPTGKSVAEEVFPGRRPSIRALGKGQFVILYDSSIAMETDARICGVGMDLKSKWDISAGFNCIGVDAATISSIPSGLGFVVTGANINKSENLPHLEWQICQYDDIGNRVSRSAVLQPEMMVLNATIGCGASTAYIAVRTKGMFPWDVLEAALFKSPLENPK